MKLGREELIETLRRRLNDEDFEHTLRVESYIRDLALRHGLDPEKAALAGLLHDWARGLGAEELVALASETGIPIDPVDRTFPYLLHAPVGAALLGRDLGLADGEVLQAVRRHTVGDRGMSRLDKLLYVADLTEPGRPYPGLEPVREAAQGDLEEAFKRAYAHKLEHVIRRRRPLHPLSAAVWNEICGIRNG